MGESMSGSIPEKAYLSIGKSGGDCLDFSIAFAPEGGSNHLAGLFSGEIEGHFYHGVGMGNPTVYDFGQLVALGESNGKPGYGTVTTASGMSATHVLILSLFKDGGKKKGRLLYSPALYGGTFNLFFKLLPRIGVKCQMIENPKSLNSWKKHLGKKEDVLFVETPSNPKLEVFDIKKLADLAHEHNAILVVDNTIATFAIQQPLLYGADIVVVSASKAIGGRSEDLGGYFVASQDVMKILKQSEWVDTTRPVMSPRTAGYMIEGVASLHKRIVAHSQNAFLLANWLSQRPNVSGVYYPFIEQTDESHYDIACKQMKYGGPLLSFELCGDLKDAQKFVDSLVVAKQAPHIGDASHTLVIHPASTTHSRVPKEEREKLGISDTLIRVSVSAEDGETFSKIFDDFRRALEKIKR